MSQINLFTIGFTKKSAENFFSLLRNAGVKRILDIRLNNSSQLAGFAKKDDLEFFLREICGIQYTHLPPLAPTKEIMDAYKKQKGDWSDYEESFLDLMRRRNIEGTVSPELLHESCLLCSEHTPQHCHRRLVAEYIQRFYPNLRTTHLV